MSTPTRWLNEGERSAFLDAEQEARRTGSPVPPVKDVKAAHPEYGRRRVAFFRMGWEAGLRPSVEPTGKRQ